MGGRTAATTSKRSIASNKRTVSPEVQADKSAKPVKRSKHTEPNYNLDAINRPALEALLDKSITDHPKVSKEIIDDHRSKYYSALSDADVRKILVKIAAKQQTVADAIIEYTQQLEAKGLKFDKEVAAAKKMFAKCRKFGRKDYDEISETAEEGGLTGVRTIMERISPEASSLQTLINALDAIHIIVDDWDAADRHNAMWDREDLFESIPKLVRLMDDATLREFEESCMPHGSRGRAWGRRIRAYIDEKKLE